MPIPDLTSDGLLPPGVHDCSVEEVRTQFGSFQGTNRRPHLFAKLEQYLTEVRQTGLVGAVIIDGSFVTATAAPNDIDVILLLRPDHDFSAELRPFDYNVLSGRQARRRYGVDAFGAAEGSALAAEYLEFFTRVREKPTQQKGLLRVAMVGVTAAPPTGS